MSAAKHLVLPEPKPGYRGVEMDGDRKLYAYVEIPTEDSLKERFDDDWGIRLYPKKVGMGGRAGSLFSFVAIQAIGKGKASIFPSTGKWLGYWSDKKLVAEWQMTDDALNHAALVLSQEKKAKRKNAWKAALEPVRAAYHRAWRKPRQQAVILTMVNAAIMGTTRLDRDGDDT